MKKILSLLFLFTSLMTIYSQQGWFWQNQVPQGNTLNAVFAIDENNAVAVGECGSIIRTTDGGSSWLATQYPDTNSFSYVYFINNMTGWIVGGKYVAFGSVNIILKTVDGGNNWFPQQSGLVNYELKSICFLNANTGYAAGGEFNEGKIIKSTNGGTNWQTLNITFSKEVYSLCFINANTGWAGTGSGIYKTTDGGVSWGDSTIVTGRILSMVFTDNLTGYAAKTIGSALKTTNGGVNWVTVGANGSTVDFIDQQTGWMTGPSNPVRIYKTTNSGTNWQLYQCQTTENLTSVSFANSQTGWAVGWYGAIQKTTNGGVNWTDQLNGFLIDTFGDSYFVNENTGFVVGGMPLIPNPPGYVYKTTNGGNTWSLRFQLTVQLKGVNFVNENTGWACGTAYTSNYRGTIIKSTDGGDNWEEQYSILIEDYNNIKFFNASTGFVFGYNTLGLGGKILKTTNGGTNWQTTNLGGQSVIFQAHFLDVNTGWVSCMGGLVYRTTNSGANWVSQPTGINDELHSIHFINPGTGWVGTLGGSLYCTTNGGSTWNKQYEMDYFVSDIEFVNNQFGWAVSSTGEIIYTTNTGANWNHYPRMTFNVVKKALFISPGTGWLFGGKGMILKTTNGGGLVAIQNTMGVIPDDFLLYQNYPNPFNPVTNIKFDLPRSGFIKLTIYDLLGGEITQLVNQQMEAGSYSADWDASAYPSGVYFYKIEAGDFTEAKKMILLK